MEDDSLRGSNPYPIVDWELDRHAHTGDILLRLRYFTASMQSLDEAERGAVYSLTVEKAIELSRALERALQRPAPKA